MSPKDYWHTCSLLSNLWNTWTNTSVERKPSTGSWQRSCQKEAEEYVESVLFKMHDPVYSLALSVARSEYLTINSNIKASFSSMDKESIEGFPFQAITFHEFTFFSYCFEPKFASFWSFQENTSQPLNTEWLAETFVAVLGRAKRKKQWRWRWQWLRLRHWWWRLRLATSHINDISSRLAARPWATIFYPLTITNSGTVDPTASKVWTVFHFRFYLLKHFHGLLHWMLKKRRDILGFAY